MRPPSAAFTTFMRRCSSAAPVVMQRSLWSGQWAASGRQQVQCQEVQPSHAASQSTRVQRRVKTVSVTHEGRVAVFNNACMCQHAGCITHLAVHAMCKRLVGIVRSPKRHGAGAAGAGISAFCQEFASMCSAHVAAARLACPSVLCECLGDHHLFTSC